MSTEIPSSVQSTIEQLPPETFSKLNDRATGTYADVFGPVEALAYFNSVREARIINAQLARRTLGLGRYATNPQFRPDRSILL